MGKNMCAMEGGVKTSVHVHTLGKSKVKFFSFQCVRAM